MALKIRVHERLDESSKSKEQVIQELQDILDKYMDGKSNYTQKQAKKDARDAVRGTSYEGTVSCAFEPFVGYGRSEPTFHGQMRWIISCIKSADESKLTESFNLKTVKIGDQAWMAENLSVDDGGEGVTKNGKDTYYSWIAANRIADSIPGWHLPSNKEWTTLIDNAGGTFYAGDELKNGPFGAESNDDFWSSTPGSSATYFHFSRGNDVQSRQSVTSSGSFTTGRTEMPCLVRLIKD